MAVDTTPPDQTRLIQALLDPARYPHPVERVECIETHISTVLLAGDYAYKIKKPLNLGFLDFTALADRAHYCAEEIRLNSRLAPEIYLRTIPICGTADAPTLDGSGDPIEYAVLMRRFPQEAQLDRRFAHAEIGLDVCDRLAARIAEFHAQVARTDATSPYGSPEAVLAPMRENFAQIAPLIADAETRDRLDRLADWTDTRYLELAPSLAQRRTDGFVRECHGDMHLANIALWNGDLIIFDGIEFNPDLRWIDVISEIAFLTMDLDSRGAAAHSHRVLNTYLEHTGDYAGLGLLRFYQVYRCMVRAKVNAIRAFQPGADDETAGAAWRDSLKYLALAETYARPGHPRLVLTHGYSGSGKTTVAQVLVDDYGYVRIRSDVERKRLHGLAADARSRSALGGGLYTAAATGDTYARLAALAEPVLWAGLPALIDATFLKRSQRESFFSLAERLAVPVNILDVQASEATIRERIHRRSAEATDASEADLEVLTYQLRTAEPLSDAERTAAVTVDAGRAVAAAALAELAPT